MFSFSRLRTLYPDVGHTAFCWSAKQYAPRRRRQREATIDRGGNACSRKNETTSHRRFLADGADVFPGNEIEAIGSPGHTIFTNDDDDDGENASVAREDEETRS